MYQALDPILISDPKAKWLTVGDGRFGRDAKYIIGEGCYALASDISDCLLEEARQIGYLSEYKRENAEALSFQDYEFDYVLCKESYHHFPRPMLALYEMLRVARKGVFLIEPNDVYINRKALEILFRNLKNIIKSLLHKKINKHAFEEAGNYVFSISRREIEKVALGLNLKIIAFKGINDVYFKGAEQEKLSENGPLQRKIKLLINIRNLLCRLGLMDYKNIVAIIFNEVPSKESLQLLNQEEYEIVHLPKNPFIP